MAIPLCLTLLPALLGAAPPAIDTAVRQLCEAGQAPTQLCSMRSGCDAKKAPACAGSDQAEKQKDEDWTEWRCETDRKNGYLSCTSKTHVTTGPGEGDVLETRYDAALFVAKSGPLVGIAQRGERPAAWFFSLAAHGWVKAEPLPELTGATFGLKEPRAPKQRDPAMDGGFHAEFFVELTLPRIGTSVSAEGRWVNTFRDDSGYGQSDTPLSSASRELVWNRATGTFSVKR